MPLFTYPKPLHHTLPMARLIIHGGARLSGTHRTPGNKNAALPMLTAALLTDEPVILENLPLIQDVRTTLEQLGRLGVEIDLDEARTVRLRAPRYPQDAPRQGPLFPRALGNLFAVASGARGAPPSATRRRPDRAPPRRYPSAACARWA